MYSIPFNSQSLYGFQDGYDMQDLVLLQTFLGLSLAVGIVVSGSSINKTCQVANSRKIRISRQYVCQGCVVLVSISIVIFSMLSNNYHTLCAVTWVYGFGLGGYRCKWFFLLSFSISEDENNVYIWRSPS